MIINRTQRMFLLLFFIAAAVYGQNDALFNSGKDAYKKGAYQEAINNWKKILTNDTHSAEVYFNLGNAQYKLNNIGPSIYYYEKSLQLDPNDSDIKNNLAFAENARVDSIEPLPQTVFSTWYKRVSGVFSFNGWALSGVVFSSIFVVLFLAYYYATSEKKKRVLFTSSLLSVLFLICSVVIAFMTYADAEKSNPAIIFSESVDVKDAPSTDGEVSYIIHEGTKVQLLERDSDWVRIRLADGKDGWIPSADMKEL